MNDVYRRKVNLARDNGDIGGIGIKRRIDPVFVQEYVKGIDTWQRGDCKSATKHFSKALRNGPEGGYGYIYYFLSNCQIQRGNSEGALKALNRSLELDSTIYPSHLELLSGYSRTRGFASEAEFHREYLSRLMPWASRDIDSIISLNK